MATWAGKIYCVALVCVFRIVIAFLAIIGSLNFNLTTLYGETFILFFVGLLLTKVGKTRSGASTLKLETGVLFIVPLVKIKFDLSANRLRS